ncbi:unnamed protein product [Parnassius apollo]|uniref:(apollo) hypothetical protein n=1 Tax=Parnassius apollo TaxID=110799 RepID=A0A8S3X5F4_PARAO|nr:unnamed protein product [Parnassius apollo]
MSVAAAAAAAIEEQFYADDLLLSGDDEHRIAQVALEVDRVLRTANFHLHQSKWRWVPSNENPADLLSRGVLPDKLVNCTSTSKFWFEGPTFLSKPQEHPGTRVVQCSLNRQKPVKAAVLIFGDQLEIIHDPQLVTATEAAVLLIAGNLKLGVVSVYLEGEQDPYLRRIQSACAKLHTNNIIVAGDINAWSRWWGSNSEDEKGAACNTFLNEMDLHILNTGDTPTFETYRRGRICSSIVDVTACSSSLLGNVEDWRVERSLITSDHNAIMFTLRTKAVLTQLRPCITRKYNTRKANWSDFSTRFRSLLKERAITPTLIEEAEIDDDLESITIAYTKAIQESCDETIPKWA